MLQGCAVVHGLGMTMKPFWKAQRVQSAASEQAFS